MDGVQVVVPDSLERITPYVLAEQGDWFEDEIRFLRRLVQPGMKVIDIGASYGVYALTMARIVGPTGRVWAFEPAAGTARMLAASIRLNGFPQLTLETLAVSGRCGEARLRLDDQSELNALVRGEGGGGPQQTVATVSLDSGLERWPWRDIDLVKLDAEGEEGEILRGGAAFFRTLSPLVLYEIKVGTDLNLSLVRQFADLGYDAYRLVPGLDLLVPFDPALPPDGYLLNLFACRPDRAEGLAARGLLVRAAEPELLSGLSLSPWEGGLAPFPYAEALLPFWQRRLQAAPQPRLERALALHALSRDPAAPAPLRFEALSASLATLQELCAEDSGALRLATLARVARDHGARALAVAALRELEARIRRDGLLDAEEPFLVPSRRFETLAPGDAIGNWLMAAVLEERERLGSFSAFFTGDATLSRLQDLVALGFEGPEMRRRRELIERRFAPPTG